MDFIFNSRLATALVLAHPRLSAATDYSGSLTDVSGEAALRADTRSWVNPTVALDAFDESKVCFHFI